LNSGEKTDGVNGHGVEISISLDSGERCVGKYEIFSTAYGEIFHRGHDARWITFGCNLSFFYS
jgi:hypothetical protein